MDMKVRLNLEFTVSEAGLEEGLDEFDELSVAGLVAEILDKSIACDDIVVKVVEGPNSLEEYDEMQKAAAG
jgi:hypothetical protein